MRRRSASLALSQTCFDVDVVQVFDESVEALADLIGVEFVDEVGDGGFVERLDLGGEPSLFGAELFGRDLIGVVQPEQLVPLSTEFGQSCRSVRGGAAGGLAAAPAHRLQVLADRLTQLGVTQQRQAETSGGQ